MLPLRNVVYKHKAFELARDGITPGQIAASYLADSVSPHSELAERASLFCELVEDFTRTTVVGICAGASGDGRIYRDLLVNKTSPNSVRDLPASTTTLTLRFVFVVMANPFHRPRKSVFMAAERRQVEVIIGAYEDI